MIVYRISRSKYADDLLGTGAGRYGGRWNPIGLEMLYTSSTISLTCLEYLVHNFHLLNSQSITLVKIEISNDARVKELNTEDLPHDWKEKTYLPQSTQEIGREFLLSNKDYLLKVPSAIVSNEFNVLCNPRHREHRKTRIIEKIEPFTIDERLVNH